jgi:hypothetical protein
MVRRSAAWLFRRAVTWPSYRAVVVRWPAAQPFRGTVVVCHPDLRARRTTVVVRRAAAHIAPRATFRPDAPHARPPARTGPGGQIPAVRRPEHPNLGIRHSRRRRPDKAGAEPHRTGTAEYPHPARTEHVGAAPTTPRAPHGLANGPRHRTNPHPDRHDGNRGPLPITVRRLPIRRPDGRPERTVPPPTRGGRGRGPLSPVQPRHRPRRRRNRPPQSKRGRTTGARTQPGHGKHTPTPNGYLRRHRLPGAAVPTPAARTTGNAVPAPRNRNNLATRIPSRTHHPPNGIHPPNLDNRNRIACKTGTGSSPPTNRLENRFPTSKMGPSRIRPPSPRTRPHTGTNRARTQRESTTVGKRLNTSRDQIRS